MSKFEKFDKLVIWLIGFQKIDFQEIRFFCNVLGINDEQNKNEMLDGKVIRSIIRYQVYFFFGFQCCDYRLNLRIKVLNILFNKFKELLVIGFIRQYNKIRIGIIVYY